MVNFKDCRPKSSKVGGLKQEEGDKGFVKHLGKVRYIEQGALKVNIVKNQKDEVTKDKYKLKVIGEDQQRELKEIELDVSS